MSVGGSFPAGVGPDLSSRDNNWCSRSVETRRRFGWFKNFD